jgi:hypothetical protein
MAPSGVWKRWRGPKFSGGCVAIDAKPTDEELIDLGRALWRIVKSEKPTEIIFTNPRGQRLVYVVQATRQPDREKH